VEEGIWKKVLRGLERQGEGERDEDLDEGEQYDEEGIAEVEYVSDLDDEEEDLGDIEDWLGGESADSSDDYDEDEDEDEDEDDDEDDDKDKEGDGPSEDEGRPKGKRKRVTLPPKPRKKGARYEIEYEPEGPVKESVLL